LLLLGLGVGWKSGWALHRLRRELRKRSREGGGLGREMVRLRRMHEHAIRTLKNSPVRLEVRRGEGRWLLGRGRLGATRGHLLRHTHRGRGLCMRVLLRLCWLPRVHGVHLHGACQEGDVAQWQVRARTKRPAGGKRGAARDDEGRKQVHRTPHTGGVRARH